MWYDMRGAGVGMEEAGDRQHAFSVGLFLLYFKISIVMYAEDIAWRWEINKETICSEKIDVLKSV